MGGRVADAAYYPLGLITAILRGMRNTADAEEKEVNDEETTQLKAATDVAGSLQGIENFSIILALKIEDLERENAAKILKVTNGTIQGCENRGWRNKYYGTLTR